MKKIIFITLFLESVYSLMAQPQLSGSLSGTYNNNNLNPDYIVINNIWVANNNTVTIGPNVTIQFNNNGTTGYKFDVQAGGTLVANGASGLIEFKPLNTTIGWGGINFYGAPTNNLSCLRKCKITYAKKTVNLNYSFTSVYCGGGIYIHDHNNVIIRDCEIAYCHASCGGGIFVDNSNPVIDGYTLGSISAVRYNSAIDGGGIYCSNHATPVIGGAYSINFIENVASHDGGGLFIDETSLPNLIYQNNFINNDADNGGGIFIDNVNFDLSNQVIVNNNANNGAGIYTNQVSADITGNTITGNVAGSGGGIFCNNNSSPHIYSNDVLSNNEAYYGGGIFCQEADPYIDQLIENNTAYNSGGGITINTIGSNPTFGANTEITGNTADYGGGIYLEWTDATIDGIDIYDNIANDSGGGIYISGGYPTISNCSIYSNIASSASSGYGGGIHINNGSTATITSSNIEENNAKYDGGGIYVKYSSPTIEDIDEVSNNTAEHGNGGGIFLYNSGGTINGLDNISENESIIDYPPNYTGGRGGAIYCYEGTVTIEYSNIINNHASFGCGVYFEVSNINSSPTISNCSLIGNFPNETPGIGGAIYCYKSNYYHRPMITSNTIDHNGGDEGAGIYCDNSSNYIQYNTITFNFSDGDGGGIFCTQQSDPYILYNTISDNTAYRDGGGVFCDDESNPLIQHNTITTNEARTDNGGGICVMNTDAYPTIYILNNLIASNQAYVNGGGIYLENIDGSLITNSNTISDNTAGNEGGGVYNAVADGTFYNNIIWGNYAPPPPPPPPIKPSTNSVSSAYIYANYNNFFYSDIEVSGAPGNNIDTDPIFYSSGNYHLQYNNPSPCLDVGDNNADHTSLDLDFTDRIQFTTIDMGCYEHDHTNWLIVINDIENNENIKSSNSDINVSIQPNPFTESTNITLLVNEKSKIQIIITDISGKIVYNYYTIVTNEQTNIKWKPEENAKGIYFCKIILNNEIPIIKKLIYN